MPARLRLVSPFGRVLRLATMLLVSAALIAPAAHAAPAKRAKTKKAVATAPAKATTRTPARSANKAPRKAVNVAKAAPAKGKAKGSAAGAARSGRASARSAKAPVRVAAPARLSFGHLAGLHLASDPLDLESSVALVVDQDTQEVLLKKNDQAVLPIASLTKLMTGLLVSEADLAMDELITITQDDVDTEKGSSSRLLVGSTLSRGELLHLSLMSSENRAAHALGRTYPGGMRVFVQRMNQRARELGMLDTHYVEPTGLSSNNQSSARDLATLVSIAYRDSLLRELTTSPGYEVALGSRTLQYNNTNRLIHNPSWDIGLQKTGYISEAGRCLVMQAEVAGRNIIMVFLDSTGKFSRLADAERVRSWVERNNFMSGMRGNQADNG